MHNSKKYNVMLNSLLLIEVSDAWVTWPSDPANLPQYASISAFEDDDHDDCDDDEDRMDNYDVEESDMTFWCLNYIYYISTFADDDETYAFRRMEAHFPGGSHEGESRSWLGADVKELMSRSKCCRRPIIQWSRHQRVINQHHHHHLIINIISNWSFSDHDTSSPFSGSTWSTIIVKHWIWDEIALLHFCLSWSESLPIPSLPPQSLWCVGAVVGGRAPLSSQ